METATTWDVVAMRFSTTRLVAAACLLCFAAMLLVALPGWLAQVLGLLVLADVVIMLLPWRLPRETRTTRSVVAENLAYQVMPVAAIVAVLVGSPAWLWQTGTWRWYVVAAALGAVLIAVSGLDLRKLARGDLAFLAGPKPKSLASVQAVSALACPAGEEVTFRGVIFLAPGTGYGLAVGAAAAIAFVARHHVSAHPRQMASWRAISTQALGAGAMLILTAASHSLYPALVSHLINNAPRAVLELQRANTGGRN